MSGKEGAIADKLTLSRVFRLAGETLVELETGGNGCTGEPVDLSLIGDKCLIDGKYQLLSRLGEGGMGSVYRVKHVLLDKEMALKTFSRGAISAVAWQRFQREAQAIGRLKHGNIVQVFDFGICRGNLPYYTMELFSGQSLDKRLRKGGRLPVPEAFALLAPVAAALLHAHNHGIVHRDIKPANIFLDCTAGGSVVPKVLDFGLAKLALVQGSEEQSVTGDGLVFGSPLYMSPEQAMAGSVDLRSDIYSFGCTLFEAIVGGPPFVGKTAYETIQMRILKDPPRLAQFLPAPDCDSSLEGVMRRLLARDVECRYQTFENFLSDLQDLGLLGDIDGRPSRRNNSGRPWVRTCQSAPVVRLAAADQSAAYLFAGHSPAVRLADTILEITLSSLKPPRALKMLASSAIALTCIALTVFVFAATAHTCAVRQESGAASAPAAPGVPPGLQMLFLNRLWQTSKKPEIEVAESKYYSQLGANGDRIFNFPEGVTIGSFRWCGHRPRPVQGLVAVPRGSRVHLEISEEVALNPAVLAHFRSDDIDQLACHDFANSPAPLMVAASRYLRDLTGLELEGSAVDDSCIGYINRFRQLQCLKIAQTNITARGLLGLSRLGKLEELDASDIKDVSVLLEALRACRSLRSLTLDDCNLKGEDIGKISVMSNLTDLKVDYNNIDGDDLSCLSAMPKLERLRLLGTRVGPQSTTLLGKMKHLVELHIDGSNWKAKDLPLLRKALPAGCRVILHNDLADCQKWIK